MRKERKKLKNLFWFKLCKELALYFRFQQSVGGTLNILLRCVYWRNECTKGKERF